MFTNRENVLKDRNVKERQLQKELSWIAWEALAGAL